MKGKTVNLESSVYRTEMIPSVGWVTMRLVHTPGVGFNVSEAFIRVERELPEGSIHAHMSAYNEIFNEWYNVNTHVRTVSSMWSDVDADGYIVFEGYANIVKNWRYHEKLSKVNEYVSKLKTNREMRAR